MEKPVPDALRNSVNEAVLNHVGSKSAHSDVGDALIRAVKPLGDAQRFCPNPAQCRYLVVSTQDIVFAFAVGMNVIAFRLDPVLKGRALRSGADDIPELGSSWASFALFRNDWPDVDLTFWARKAYLFARETKV